MTLSELRYLCYTDLYRYGGRTSLGQFVRKYLMQPGFCCTFHYRLAVYLNQFRRNIIVAPARIANLLMMIHSRWKFGISIPIHASIGRGLYIVHFGGITLGDKVVLGDNCQLSQEVTLGHKPRGARAGSPVVGDNVYIGPGAKIIGGIRLGDWVAVGANAVVTHDAEPSAVVAGVPAREISREGAHGYVNNTDYLDYEAWRSRRRR